MCVCSSSWRRLCTAENMNYISQKAEKTDCTEKRTIIAEKDPVFALAFAGFFLYTVEAVTLIA